MQSKLRLEHSPVYRVKLATDLKSQKKVAVKILKAREGRLYPFCKRQALEFFRTEIGTLEACAARNLPNVVRIKDASFDGTVVKELTSPALSPSDSALSACSSSPKESA